jgi:hypothetical protein
MLITGHPITDVLTYLILALPLLSVCFILFRKEYTQESLTLVMLLCLFHFIQRLLVQYNHLLEFNSPILHNLFNVLEFFLLASIYKSNVDSRRFNLVIHSFIIAYFSSTITYFAIQGMDDDRFLLKIIQNGLVILLMAFVIYHQMIRPQMMPMQTPLFWIALATIFYFGFAMFWATGKEYLFNEGESSEQLAQNFGLFAIAIRFLVYAIAIWFLEPAQTNARKHAAREVEEKEKAEAQASIPAVREGRVSYQVRDYRPVAVPSGRIG